MFRDSTADLRAIKREKIFRDFLLRSMFSDVDVVKRIKNFQELEANFKAYPEQRSLLAETICSDDELFLKILELKKSVLSFNVLYANHLDIFLIFIKKHLARHIDRFSADPFIVYLYAKDYVEVAEIFFEKIIKDTNTTEYKNLLENFKTVCKNNKTEDVNVDALLRDIFFDYLCKLDGMKLKSFPYTLEQYGLHCAYYAVHGAALYHYLNYPELFPKLLSFPRKCNLTLADTSLRELSKAFINRPAGIFNAHEIVKIVGLTGCIAEVKEVQYSESIEEFASVIRTAINNNYPVIVPYAIKNSLPANDPYGSHWGIVVGYSIVKALSVATIYISTHGNLFAYNMKYFCDHYFNVEPVLSELHLVKKAHCEWEKYPEEQPKIDGAKYYSEKQVDFTLFRRKLIVVKPPPVATPLLGIKQKP